MLVGIYKEFEPIIKLQRLMQLLHTIRTPTHSSYSALCQEIDAFTWVQMHRNTQGFAAGMLCSPAR